MSLEPFGLLSDPLISAPVLPYVPALLRAWLLDDPGFAELTGGRCYTARSPRDVTRPYAVCQSPGGFPADASAGAWLPLVQVNGWCAPGNGLEPEVVAWNIAARAAAVLSRARNVAWEDADGLISHWSLSRVTDGPLPVLDKTRGEDAPLYGCLVRAELRVKVEAQ
jgi:hypothetical protein